MAGAALHSSGSSEQRQTPGRAVTHASSVVQSLSPRETLLSLGSAIVSITIVGMGLSLTMPLLAVRLDEQGFSARAIGLNSTAAGLAVIVGAAAVPAFMRYFGVKRLLLLAVFVSCLSLASFASTQNYWFWLAVRAVFSGALSALFVSSEYWINALAPPRHRGFVLGFYATSLAAGFAIGPMILGFTGTGGIQPFLTGIALFLLAGAPVILWSGKPPAILRLPGVSYLTVLGSVPLAAFAGLLHGAIETACLALLPVYAMRSGRSAETGALLVSLFSLGNVVFQLPAGFLSDRMERGKLLVWLAFLSLCGALAMGLAGPGQFLLFCWLLVVWGGIAGSLYAVGLAHLGSRYQGPDLASANATFIMLYAAGMIAGPPIAGLGMDLYSPNGLFFSIAALLTLYLALSRLPHIKTE
ncbi:MAG: MFS transporter [Methylocapsa sp.]|nr:MFS transporter [Methylocapsa sp.]